MILPYKTRGRGCTSDIYTAALSSGNGAPRCTDCSVCRERKEGMIPGIRAKSEDRCTWKFRKHKVKACFLLKKGYQQVSKIHSFSIIKKKAVMGSLPDKFKLEITNTCNNIPHHSHSNLQCGPRPCLQLCEHHVCTWFVTNTSSYRAALHPALEHLLPLWLTCAGNLLSRAAEVGSRWH